ncbi:AAA family ATPase [Atlantibacter subterranea]|uniref:AAA family ATPase n=1 Tax=Atlantibacter subterraneus TaxID=255519 RepID=A0ABU4DW19_9ENTR|nr:AAA family ATPase [Atlantibacter subterranea]MDV7021073.1 AAA family ATPase [Atlantibacter subterranea]MDZ5664829.1 AAA family ATPase [Atlantibacter hermannii]
MELIYTYIYSYKGLRELSLPSSSKYIFAFKGNSLSIVKKDLSRDYYENIPCTLILGKNGVGKSSILDFINSFIYDFEGSGYCIWHENNKFYVTTSNYTPPEILTKIKTQYFDNNEYFFKKNQISLVKINNTIDLTNMLVGRKKKKNTSIATDLSISYFLQGSKIRSKLLLKQLIEFSEQSSWAKNKLTNLDTRFQFEIESSPTHKVNSILKNNEIGDKGLYGAISYFNETLQKKAELNELPPYVEHDLNSQGFLIDDIVNDTFNFQDEDVINIVFNKNRLNYINAYLSYKDIIYLMFMPTITWHLLKSSKIPKETCENIYIYCLCRIYLENSNPVDVIINTIEHLVENTGTFKKLHSVMDNILRTLDYISKELEDIQLDYFNEFSFTLANPNKIIKLIGHVDKLPSSLSSRFKYGWDSLSSGELAKLNLFNQLYHSIKYSNSKNIIMLLDECDLYLHPEWQRKIFSEIINFIAIHQKDKNVQMIFTTHSPILASDFLPSDIIYLEKEVHTNTYIKDVNFGFGATISELYINAFFIEATIGQHAQHYLNLILASAENNELNKNHKVIITQVKNKLLKNLIENKINTINKKQNLASIKK